MNAHALLSDLSEKGFRLSVEGQWLRVVPTPDPDELEKIRGCRDELLAILKTSSANNYPFPVWAEEIETTKQTACDLGDMLPDGADKEELYRLLAAGCDESLTNREERWVVTALQQGIVRIAKQHGLYQ